MASTAFYNGDPSLLGPNGGNFLDCANCRGSSVHIFDDLTLSVDYSITDLSGAWELLTANDTNIPTSAYWEIRSGIGQNNSGTLITSGTSSLSTSLIPGANVQGGGTGATYFRGTVSSLSINLSPGTYWMMIAPVLINNDETFLIGTNGANGVNSLLDGQSYVTGPYWPGMQNVGAYLQPFNGQSTYDFSYGALGAATAPEPRSLGMIMAGSVMLLMLCRGRRARRS